MTKVYSPESSSKVTVCKRTMPSAEVSPGLSTVGFPSFFEWKIDVWYALSGVFCWWYFNTHIYLGKTKSSSSHFFLLIFVWVEIAYAQTNTLEIEIVRFKKKHSFQKCSRCSSLICNVLTTLPRNRVQVAWMRCLTHQCPNVTLPCNFRWHWPITRCFEDLHSIPWFWDQWPRLWKGGVSWNIGEINLRNLKIWERTTTNLWELFPQLIKQFCLVSWCQTAVPWNLNGSKIKNPSLIA